jgi:hypothetical protein
MLLGRREQSTAQGKRHRHQVVAHCRAEVDEGEAGEGRQVQAQSTSKDAAPRPTTVRKAPAEQPCEQRAASRRGRCEASLREPDAEGLEHARQQEVVQGQVSSSDGPRRKAGEEVEPKMPARLVSRPT